MEGSIRFNPDINIEVSVDPTAAEGERLTSAKNLVDGQELGTGSGDAGYDVIIKVNTAEGDIIDIEVIKDSDDLETRFITDPSSIKAFVYRIDTDNPDAIVPCFATQFSYDGVELGLNAYNNYISGNYISGYLFYKSEGEWFID